METRSTVELSTAGVYPYAVHPTTHIWLFAYAFDDEAPEVWFAGQPLPDRIAAHIEVGGELRAWNAGFERVLWREQLSKVYGFPEPMLAQWWCTAAEAAAMALPRGLDQAAAVTGVKHQKDMAGYKLMRKMCIPRTFTKEGAPVWWDDQPSIQRLGTYAKGDVEAERAIGKAVRRLNPREREVFLLDQQMNDRGIMVDFHLVDKAQVMARAEIMKQNQLLDEATGGKVTKVTKVQKLKAWLAEQGLETKSLNKVALKELLDDKTSLSPEVQAALEARQEAAKSSVAKLDAMLDCVGHDDRCRGLLLYHGASTGRWSGKRVQPHNFPRGTIPNVAQYIPGVLDGTCPAPRLEIISSMLRSMIIAPEGSEFFCADFAAIEARVLAWVTGCELMLDQFRDGKPIYKEMASVIEGIPVSEIQKPSREYQLGKNTILGCGFGMGWRHFAETTGVDEGTAKTAVNAYRGTYPEVPMFWDAMNQAAINAVLNPGEVFNVNRIKFSQRGAYLWMALPSKRSLAYHTPKVVDRPTPWGEVRPAVEFSGMNSYSHQWERLATYGGSLTENCVQALARDLLADAMLRVEEAGYPVVLTVHDEVVSEVDMGRDFEHFMGLMKVCPTWAAGTPIDAEGWHGQRYRK